MTLKTQRRLAVFGGTVLCAMLTMLITTRFASDETRIAESSPEENSAAEIPEINSEIIPEINPEISKPKMGM